MRILMLLTLGLVSCGRVEAMSPRIFRPGEDLKQIDINNIVDRLIHQITGGRDIRVRTFGDRLVIERTPKRFAAAEEESVLVPSWMQFRSSLDGNTLFGFAYWGPEYDYYKGLYKSTDAGENWSEIPQTPTPILAAYDRIVCSGDGTIFVALESADEWFISTDGGSSWSADRCPGDAAFISDTAISSDGSRVFILGFGDVGGTTYMRVWNSVDYGQNWTAVSVVAATAAIYTRMACSSNGQYVLAVRRQNATYVSSDYGATWTPVLAGRNAKYKRAVACSPDGKYMMVLERNGYLNYSSNYGVSWSVKDFALTLAGGEQDVVVSDEDGSGNRYIYVTMENTVAPDMETWVSANGGSTWTEVYPESAYDNAEAVLYALAADRYGTKVWIAGAERSIAKSTDYGANWEATGYVSGDDIPPEVE